MTSVRRDLRPPTLTALVNGLFLLVVLAVVLRGAPLRDDFDVCVNPRWISGPARMLAELWLELGMVRLLGRFTELSLIAGLCDRVPFGLIILIPLTATFAVGYLLKGVLYDLRIASPWGEIAAALWFLQPLGTEAALWPAALHIPMGLALGLAALRVYIRGRILWAAILGLTASWSLEQTLFALPLAVWVVTPRHHRLKATTAAGVVAASLIVLFMCWPGTSSRTAVPLGNRVIAVVTDPLWYARFPAVGTGAISIPLAIWWLFPSSVFVLAVGTLVGARLLPKLPFDQQQSLWTAGDAFRIGAVFVSLAVLVNLPLMVTLPHEHGPRVFAPTWLLLCALTAVVGSRLKSPGTQLVGGVGGMFAAGALLSLALSVSVRVHTADFTEQSSRWLGGQVPDGGRVVVCNVARTVVSPAPNGPFALHELHDTWSAEAAVKYYTGRQIHIDRMGAFWDGRCDDLLPADLVVDFDELRRRSRPSP